MTASPAQSGAGGRTEMPRPGARAGQWCCVDCLCANDFDARACEGCGAIFGGELAASAAKNRQRLRRGSAGVREAGLVLALLILWKLVGSLSWGSVGHAVSRGRTLWGLERRIGLPSERSLQRLVLAHGGLVQALNLYYDAVHVPSLLALLGWLWWRHRACYRPWRTAVVAVTGLSLLVALVPVAPPRLVPGLGIVDTAMRDHESLYGPLTRGVADQLSAFPSVHVAWALLVAAAVITVGRSRRRWFILVHPIVTVVAVVATGNHYWLDGIAAAVIVTTVLWTLQALGHRGRPTLLRHSDEPALCA